MDKKEFIEQLIEARKKSANAMSCICKNVDCTECPYLKSDYCSADIVDDLLDYIIENELERQETTNLEHYIKETGLVALKKDDYIEISFAVDKKVKKELMESGIRDWLLSPYEKPKYKLTKFEYDLLSCYCTMSVCITETWTVYKMQSKGYFKDIPTDVPIKDILDNCEVVEE